MSYPILAPSDTWYTSSTPRSTFTTINIVDVADETTISTATESWAAAVDSNDDGAFDNDIMCYINGTTLTIAGNGSGSIYLNPDSSWAFSNHNKTNRFNKVTTFSNADLLDSSKVTTMERMFELCGMTTIDVSNWNTSNVISMKTLFSQCSNLTTVDVSNWNTSSCKDMTGMFQGCPALTELNVSNWDVSKVESFLTMFLANTNGTVNRTLKELDVSNWDTSSCKDMTMMFYARNLGTVDVSNWDVSKVTTFDHMFAHSNMSGIDVSKWDTSSATSMYGMFHTIKNTTIDVSSFDTSNVEAFGQMFEYMSNLTEIKGLENFDTSNGIDFDEMFNGCTNLTKLDLSSFDTRKATFNNIQVSPNGSMALSTWCMFNGMSSLQEIKLGENFTFTGDGTTKSGYPCGKLPTPNSSYIAGADGNWYTIHRKSYTPANIPNNTAAIYYASVDLVNNIDYLIKNGTMLDIADAVRIVNANEEKMLPATMLENIQLVANANAELEEALYSNSEGGKSWYDRFWDSYQLNGTRTSYMGAFGAGWNKENFKPKYIIEPSDSNGAYGMFAYFGYGGSVIDYREIAHYFDWSTVGGQANMMFQDARIDYIDIDLSRCAALASAFSEGWGSGKKTHLTIKISEKCTSLSSAFSYCTTLTHLFFADGSVVQANIDLKDCPLIKESIESVINALSPTVTGKTVTFKKTAKEAAFTADEWAALIATKPNWTFSLV